MTLTVQILPDCYDGGMNKVTRFIRHHQRVRHAVYQTDDNIRRAVVRTALILLSFVTLHIFAMVWLEGMSAWSAIWLTLTTITTVGYGDLSASTPLGQLATIVLMYVCGITLMTFLISDYVDYRIARRERIRTGHWDWNMADHILIINSPKYNREAYFLRLISQIRESGEYPETPIMLLNQEFADGLPDSLRQLGVVHVTGLASRPDDLKRAGAERARHIVVLARDEYSTDSDSYSFDIAHRLYSLHINHKVMIECVDDANRERLRELDIPVILLTARGDEDDRISGLDAGADDYVVKPFSPRELIARIRAVLRRTNTSGDGMLSAGKIELDRSSQGCNIAGNDVSLGPLEFRLLEFFMLHPNRVYSRAQLLDRVWGGNVYVEDRTVDVHIRRLRKAISIEDQDKLIQTVRGAGYRFSPDE